MECPLTVWERGLRIAEMDDETRGRYESWEFDPMENRPTFAKISHYTLLYRLEEGHFSCLGVSNSTFFHSIHILFGILVVCSWIMGPPESPMFLSKAKDGKLPHLKGNNA